MKEEAYNFILKLKRTLSLTKTLTFITFKQDLQN